MHPHHRSTREGGPIIALIKCKVTKAQISKEAAKHKAAVVLLEGKAKTSCTSSCGQASKKSSETPALAKPGSKQ